MCWIRVRILTGLSQYPVFKVQAQRGATLRVLPPAVNRIFEPILKNFRDPVSGTKKAPTRKVGGVGAVPDQYDWFQHLYPIALTTVRSFKPRSVSESRQKQLQ